MLGNLVPSAPIGLTRSIAFTNLTRADRGNAASIEKPIYLSWWARNDGRRSIRDPFDIALYLDDSLIETWRAEDASVSRSFSVIDWEGIATHPDLTPGEHVLRLVLDAGSEVEEINETDNVYEMAVTVTGETALVPTPTPASDIGAPEPLTKPNLIPYWRFGWGDPVTLSKSSSRRTNDIMVVGQGGHLRALVLNESLLAARPFDLEIYFDDKLVKTWELGTLPGGYLYSPGSRDIIPDIDPREGPHTIKMVIDPKNKVDETNEDDNVFETTIEWLLFEPDPPPPISFSDQELEELFANLKPLLSSQTPVLSFEKTNVDPQIAVNMADAGYFLITGKSIRDEPVVIQMLGDGAYRRRITELFEDDFATSPTHLYPSILERRERFKTNVVGFTTNDLGKVVVVVNAERPFDAVLSTLAHEFGHARQRIEGSHQEDAPNSHALRGLSEADAFQFQRVFWLTLEEHLGEQLLAYPDLTSYRQDIDRWLRLFESGAGFDQHDLGRLLTWGVLFTDDAVSHLADEVRATGALNAGQALELYNHLIGKDVMFIDLYVDSRFEEFDALIEEIRSVAYSRLVMGLTPELEGAPALTLPALLVP